MPKEGGIRLVANQLTWANQIMVVPTFREFGRKRGPCPTCSRTGRDVVHETKHYHLRFDDQGAVIVSSTILDQLRVIGLDRLGLQVDSRVADPPKLIISSRMPPDQRTVRILHDALKGIAPPGAKITVSSKTKGKTSKRDKG